MIGQTIGGATTALIQGLFMFIIVFFVGGLGFHAGILLALAFMVLIGLAFTAMGIAIASRMEDMQGFQLIMNFVILPIFFLSGALFPIANLPSFLKVIVYINPLTYGIDGMRYGLLGTSTFHPIVSFLVIGGFGLVMILLGAWSFNRIKF
jgi:ABC-2 type transport system permease protein